jgi:hypothetical protein
MGERSAYRFFGGESKSKDTATKINLVQEDNIKVDIKVIVWERVDGG